MQERVLFMADTTVFATTATLNPATNQSSRQGHGQVPAASRRLQSGLHTAGSFVSRKPVPRHPAETSGAVVSRQRLVH